MMVFGIAFEAPDNGAGGSFNGAGPIDFDHLRRQTMGDPDLEVEVLQLFARQVRCCMQEMATGDTAAIMATAHKLKGAASAVGALRVSIAAERLEATPDDAALLAKLSAAVTATENFILKLCR